MPDLLFNIDVHGGAIVVTLPEYRFEAVYYKPLGQSHLALRRCSLHDQNFLAKAWEVANDMARELGWIA
jgi:hypothetical protein